MKIITFIAVISALGSCNARAADVVKITIPRHSELTPVQRLNREGVEAVNKHRYEKASGLFYKAYLYDPTDPFTLNNLGYISELQGELDRAQKFYALASEQGSSANIDRSNAKQLVGKPMQSAFEGLQDNPMRVNRMNIDAMGLLSENRGLEAVALLKKTLALDAQNPFTLNNLGVADETIGDYEGALKCYSAAVESHSSEPVVVTLDRSWRGRSVSAMAAASANRLEDRMKKMGTAELSAVLLTVQGVAATNRNDPLAAREDFLHAYSLNPESAFSLNNRAYVAEMEGDLETAQFFYKKARGAADSSSRVGLATQHADEGKKLTTVALESHHMVDGELDKYSRARHLESSPIELTPRGAAPGGKSGASPERPSTSDLPPSEAPLVPQLH